MSNDKDRKVPDLSPSSDYFEKKYRKVPGNPAFPPPSLRAEESYIERMLIKEGKL